MLVRHKLFLPTIKLLGRNAFLISPLNWKMKYCHPTKEANSIIGCLAVMFVSKYAPLTRKLSRIMSPGLNHILICWAWLKRIGSIFSKRPFNNYSNIRLLNERNLQDWNVILHFFKPNSSSALRPIKPIAHTHIKYFFIFIWWQRRGGSGV